MGFEVIYTLYADALDRPIYGDPKLKLAHDAAFKKYEATVGSTWPLLADIGWQLEPFFDVEGLPLVVLIKTEDMSVLMAKVGHNSEATKALIEGVLEP